MDSLFYMLGILTGIGLGLFISAMKHTDGVLKIDKSSPEKDTYKFEIDDLSSLDKVKWVRLRIKRINSHK